MSFQAKATELREGLMDVILLLTENPQHARVARLALERLHGMAEDLERTVHQEVADAIGGLRREFRPDDPRQEDPGGDAQHQQRQVGHANSELPPGDDQAPF